MSKPVTQITLLLTLVVVSVFLRPGYAAGQVQHTGFVSYIAMNKDHIPGRRNLNHPGAFANTYTRGCEKEERCRGGSEMAAATT
ncbi:hypothetical protein PR202_ga27901 [Eleusine coracana subsp. coracana]|uniref:Uncharacterized protein n=1 Tax=Eleusine coracana subsp. coracana TaxID=191504 RepID=A0AAV5DHG0_ELECO|nr:hypothetical protein PR202_ga27901 [Eleusine coracana subsp. coracana]